VSSRGVSAAGAAVAGSDGGVAGGGDGAGGGGAGAGGAGRPGDVFGRRIVAAANSPTDGAGRLGRCFEATGFEATVRRLTRTTWRWSGAGSAGTLSVRWCDDGGTSKSRWPSRPC
jgi:hypothetical protein